MEAKPEVLREMGLELKRSESWLEEWKDRECESKLREEVLVKLEDPLDDDDDIGADLPWGFKPNSVANKRSKSFIVRSGERWFLPSTVVGGSAVRGREGGNSFIQFHFFRVFFFFCLLSFSPFLVYLFSKVVGFLFIHNSQVCFLQFLSLIDWSIDQSFLNLCILPFKGISFHFIFVGTKIFYAFLNFNSILLCWRFCNCKK